MDDTIPWIVIAIFGFCLLSIPLFRVWLRTNSATALLVGGSDIQLLGELGTTRRWLLKTSLTAFSAKIRGVPHLVIRYEYSAFLTFRVGCLPISEEGLDALIQAAKQFRAELR